LVPLISRYDAVPFCDQVEDLDVEVGERLADHLDAAADGVWAGRGVEDDRVVRGDIGRDEFVDDVGVPLVEALLVEPTDERLVGFESVGHLRDCASRRGDLSGSCSCEARRLTGTRAIKRSSPC
jgi:hypothetical protein